VQHAVHRGIKNHQEREIMTVAQLQALLSDFDPEAPVTFGYPAVDKGGVDYQERTKWVCIKEIDVNGTGTFAPIFLLDGALLPD
jgi:hypothetical protein